MMLFSREIAVLCMRVVCTSIVVLALMGSSSSLAQCGGEFVDEFLDLNDNRVPDCWKQTAWDRRSGVKDGALRGVGVDGRVKLERTGYMPNSAIGLQLEYDANLAWTTWGHHSQAGVETNLGWFMFHGYNKPDKYKNNSLVQVYGPDGKNLFFEKYPKTEGTFHFTLRFIDDTIRVKIEDLKGVEYADLVIPALDLKVEHIKAIQVYTGRSTEIDSWADNLRVTVLQPTSPNDTSRQQPTPSNSMRLTPAGPGKAIDFDGDNKCISLDGNRDYIEIDMQVPQEITICAWATGVEEKMMLWCIDRDCHGPDLLFNPSSFYLNRWDGRTNPIGSRPGSFSQWHHYATVVSADKTVLYLDGRAVGQAKYRNPSGPVLYVSCGPTPLCDPGKDYSWNGKIDEFQVWDRALDQGEIRDLMKRELAGNERGLLLYYDFNELTEDGLVPDRSASRVNGSIFGDIRLVESTCPITSAPVADKRDDTPATNDDSAREKMLAIVDKMAMQKGHFSKPTRPADLYIDSVEFIEPSGNNALDGYEAGEISLVLMNRGLGEAQNIQVNLSPLGGVSGLQFVKNHTVERIDPKQQHRLSVPIRAAGQIETALHKIRIQANEEFGFDAEPVLLSFETVAYQPPDLQVPKVAINDREEGDAYGNGNSIIEPNESVVVTAFVQNFGSGKSEDTKAKVILNTDNTNLSCPDTGREFRLGDIEPGDYRELQFYFFSSRRYTSEDIPLQLELSEAKGDYGKTIDLGLKMNVRTENIVDVSIARVETAKPKIKQIAGFQKSDIDNPPQRSKSVRPNGLAVIIGIEDYKYAPAATYAARDAEAFYNYAAQVLGIPERNIYFAVNDGATVGEFMKLFDEGGWLSRRVTSESDVFVFYSGHGAPDLASKSPYLIPYDVDPNYANKGYSALSLYKNLGELGAKSVTVMLDACFSGQDREDKMLLADARPIRISVGSGGIPSNVTVLSASSGDEISSGYPEQKHGIFSYYLMKGLEGGADANGDGHLTVEELHGYVASEVSRTAGFMDRNQTPELYSDESQRILVGY